MPFSPKSAAAGGGWEANEGGFAPGQVSAQVNRAERMTFAGTKVARWRFEADGDRPLRSGVGEGQDEGR